MLDVCILRWIVKEECDEHKVLNFFYLKNNTINCCVIIIDEVELNSFKSSRKKNKFLEKILINNTFVLNENIEHLISLDDFVRKYNIEYKLRNYRIKKLIKKK